MMRYYYDGFYPPHMWGIGPILMILFWFFVIYILVSILKNNKRYDDGHGYKHTHMEILKARYAKGEITKEQFESMKKDLS